MKIKVFKRVKKKKKLSGAKFKNLKIYCDFWLKNWNMYVDMLHAALWICYLQNLSCWRYGGKFPPFNFWNRYSRTSQLGFRVCEATNIKCYFLRLFLFFFIKLSKLLRFTTLFNLINNIKLILNLHVFLNIYNINETFFNILLALFFI